MNYRETVEWLYQQLPMFQRIGPAAFKKDLTKTRQLMEFLHHPERKFKSVHVAGTNGKGSVAHSLAAIFQHCGYKTGLYTSPHLVDFRERIKVNGAMISEVAVVEFVNANKKALQDIGLSFFEMTVGMAFHHFAREQVDVAIVEVGMGGRLDSTNVLSPELGVITNISMDHAQFLGDTIPKIAGEKAGIIKADVPVVIGERQEETTPVFEEKARSTGAPLYYAEELIPEKEAAEYLYHTTYQKRNVRTILAAAHLLEEKFPELKPSLYKEALANVPKITGLRGRWEILGQKPKIIADTGHNEAGVTLNVEQLKKENYQNLHIIWGMVGDKDSAPILKLLPQEAHYYWCRADVPRGKSETELKAEAERLNLGGETYASVQAAYRAAMTNAGAKDLVFVGGSTFVVAEVL